MPALCPECGSVHPQEADGSAQLRCPTCGRTLLVEPAADDLQYATGPAAAYAGTWTAQETPAPYQAASRLVISPADIARGYDGWIVARRWLGTLIDHVVLFFVALIVLAGAEALLGEDLYQQTLTTWTIIAGAIVIAYFPVLEGLYGATAGKIVAGLRVVDENGDPPGIGKAAIRTVFRLLEVNPLFLSGLIAALFVLASRKRQRLGDMVAHTYVLLKDDADTARLGTW